MDIEYGTIEYFLDIVVIDIVVPSQACLFKNLCTIFIDDQIRHYIHTYYHVQGYSISQYRIYKHNYIKTAYAVLSVFEIICAFITWQYRLV